MGQVSWRTDDELLDRVRQSARVAGSSVNSYLTRVMEIATSEDDQSTDAERLRQRLLAAGLLSDGGVASRPRPSDKELAAAQKRARRGTPLSDLVGTMRS